jgi:hypothetical protein
MLALGAAMLAAASRANAQSATGAGFFDLARPGHLTLTLFGLGYASGKYATTSQGAEIEQSLTRHLGLVGRVSGYQLYHGTGFDSPIVPRANGSPFHMARLDGGIDLSPIEGTHLVVLGGQDFGDSRAAVIESNFSSWLGLHSRHPVNASFSADHYFNNGVTNSLIDLRTVITSTANFMTLAGAGGAVWGGGTAGAAKGQGGPDLGLYMRRIRTLVSIQIGYGSSQQYGLVAVSTHFDWKE